MTSHVYKVRLTPVYTAGSSVTVQACFRTHISISSLQQLLYFSVPRPCNGGTGSLYRCHPARGLREVWTNQHAYHPFYSFLILYPVCFLLSYAKRLCSFVGDVPFYPLSLVLSSRDSVLERPLKFFYLQPQFYIPWFSYTDVQKIFFLYGKMAMCGKPDEDKTMLFLSHLNLAAYYSQRSSDGNCLKLEAMMHSHVKEKIIYHFFNQPSPQHFIPHAV